MKLHKILYEIPPITIGYFSLKDLFLVGLHRIRHEQSHTSHKPGRPCSEPCRFKNMFSRFFREESLTMNSLLSRLEKNIVFLSSIIRGIKKFLPCSDHSKVGRTMKTGLNKIRSSIHGPAHICFKKLFVLSELLHRSLYDLKKRRRIIHAGTAFLKLSYRLCKTLLDHRLRFVRKAFSTPCSSQGKVTRIYSSGKKSSQKSRVKLSIGSIT